MAVMLILAYRYAGKPFVNLKFARKTFLFLLKASGKVFVEGTLRKMVKARKVKATIIYICTFKLYACRFGW